MKKILSVFVRFGTFLGIVKKRENMSNHDAIQMPIGGNHSIVEDFEMAAYHNQA